MSQQTNQQYHCTLQSRQVSHYTRPLNKISSYIQPIQFNNDQYLMPQQITRSPSSHKNKTFAVIDSNKKSQPKYRLNTITQRKVLLMIGFIQKFISQYEYKKSIQQQSSRKLHEQRKLAYNISNSHSEFKIIEPVCIQKINLQQSYIWLMRMRDGLRLLFRQNFVNEIKKRRSKLIRIFNNNQQNNNNNHNNLQSIIQGDKQNHYQQSLKNIIINNGNQNNNQHNQYNINNINNINNKNNNKQNKQNNNLLINQDDNKKHHTFITCDFNSTSLSQTIPNVDIMGVSNFPQDISQILQNNNIINKHKFHQLKSKSTQSRLRIHPATNKYQCRKKQQIRLFLQLNQKTQHLQNFRSDQGKFFKFNQNLKITVKNINLCRIVLLNKKNIIIQQFNRLGDQQYFKLLNIKTQLNNQNHNQFNNYIDKSNNNIDKNDKNTNNNDNKNNYNNNNKSNNKNENNNDKSNNSNNKNNNNQPKQSLCLKIPQQRFTSTFSQSLYMQDSISYKQKALRIKNYFEQTISYFNSIQLFLLSYIKKDKGYQNYLRQNRLKLKLKLYQKNNQINQFYQSFVDQCFHISQIARLYFNTLNQLTHQNISLKELKLLNKQELQKENKVLIELRYVLIYLQKQCQNTNEYEQNKYRKTQVFNMYNNKNKLITTNNTLNITPLIISQQVSSRQSNTNNLINKDIKLNNSSITNNINNKTTIFNKSILQQTNNVNNNRGIIKSSSLSNNIIKKLSVSQIPILNNVINDHLQMQSNLYNKNNHITTIFNNNNQIKQRISHQIIKQQKQIDINEIWRKFYNKKFSSNAMRLRLY